MPRSLTAPLLAAMNSGNFTPYFNVQLLDSDNITVLFSTTKVFSFDLEGLTAKVEFYDPYPYDSFTSFRIQRGVLISGTPEVITSSAFMPDTDTLVDRHRTLQGHVFPAEFFSTPGDVTYRTVIDTICGHFKQATIYEDDGAAWLSYQFLPDGRTLTLNNAKSFFTLLRQKYLIFATDYGYGGGGNWLYFYQAKTTAPAYPAGYTLVQGKRISQPGNTSYQEKTLLSRDEAGTLHYAGGTSKPIHNLGYIEAAASLPARYYFIDTPQWIIRDIPPNLKYLDFDAIRATFDNLDFRIWPTVLKESFHTDQNPPWQHSAKYLDIFANTEGGALPGTIMAAAPYTPLNTTYFDKNLNSSQNNLQAFAEAVDEMTCGPGIFAMSEMTAPDDLDIIPIVDHNTSTHLVRKLYYSTLKAKFRPTLAADRTYYVRTDGDDANTGLVNNAGGAFLTLQHAWDVLSTLDMSIYTINVHVADGTYTGGLVIDKAPVGVNQVVFTGNTGTPANVLWNVAGIIILANVPCNVRFTGFKYQTSGGYDGIYSNYPGAFISIGAAVFGSMAGGNQMRANGFGKIYMDTNYSITAGAARHMLVTNYGMIEAGSTTVTLTGTPAFTTFAEANCALISWYVPVFSGAATGRKYYVVYNAFLNTYTGVVLPGDVAGISGAGGQVA